jgi:hypothetical protein
VFLTLEEWIRRDHSVIEPAAFRGEAQARHKVPDKRAGMKEGSS